ncbi:hypothetical protein Tco_0133429 [Tanacetum coccineum]
MTTTTMEKLLAQILDQKRFIINQVKEQADSCAQQLASKLIIDGFTPPDWFPNPNFDQNAPNRNELEKEELISKLLHRHSRDSVSYSRSDCSLYYRPVFTGGKGLNASSISVRTQGPHAVFPYDFEIFYYLLDSLYSSSWYVLRGLGDIHLSYLKLSLGL